MPSPWERAAEAALLHLHGTESGHILTDAPKHPQEDKSIRKLARALLRFAAAELLIAADEIAYPPVLAHSNDLRKRAARLRAAAREKAAEEGGQ